LVVGDAVGLGVTVGVGFTVGLAVVWCADGLVVVRRVGVRVGVGLGVGVGVGVAVAWAQGALASSRLMIVRAPARLSAPIPART
jgi:hypothetical protein